MVWTLVKSPAGGARFSSRSWASQVLANVRPLDNSQAIGDTDYTNAQEQSWTMTQLLRGTIEASPSFRAIETATGLKRQSLMKFARGIQSLRLDMADIPAECYGIECRRTRR